MIIRMPYRQYKTSYSDCETVHGSYNSSSKTIEVNVPDERMKPSGVRGEHFHGYQLWLIDEKGEYGYCTYRAVSNENAMKQHVKWCKKNGWKPCEPPAEEVAKIYL